MPTSTPDTHILQVRVPKVLWERFSHVCRYNNASNSEVIREFLRAMVKEHRDLMATLKGSQTTAAASSPAELAKEQHDGLRASSDELWGDEPIK